jgi:hypothetical protein
VPVTSDKFSAFIFKIQALLLAQALWPGQGDRRRGLARGRDRAGGPRRLWDRRHPHRRPLDPV